MLTDTEGKIQYVNSAWMKIYGYSQGEALGETPRLLRSGHHGKSFYAVMWADILDPAKGYWKGEVINRTKDGREIPMLLTISPYRDKAGVIRGYMSIAVDIREKKQLEAQILRQDRLASIGLLASGLAHEIGTPLGVVRGRAEYLLEDADPGTRRNLDVIVTQIDRVSKLIYSLLHLARSGGSELTASVNVRNVVNDVGALIAPKLRQDGIRFEVVVPGGVEVVAESSRLQQVFLNLCMNSVHAIETAIRDGRKQGHRLTVSAADKGNTWAIDVTDTGCGVSKENMENLFKPFFTTKEVGEGTGLGLVVTHQIVQSWGGTMWAESVDGSGTTFRLEIPKAA
jgi:PAS domain S-box-containing protein